jgi:hypothetical protein
MSSKTTFKRAAVVGASALALALSVTPASFAGEDDDDDTVTTEQPAAPAPEENSGSSESSSGGGSGSSDTKVAVGGVQTGFGGMAADDANTMLPLSIGGALILLSAGAGSVAFRRR